MYPPIDDDELLITTEVAFSIQVPLFRHGPYEHGNKLVSHVLPPKLAMQTQINVLFEENLHLPLLEQLTMQSDTSRFEFKMATYSSSVKSERKNSLMNISGSIVKFRLNGKVKIIFFVVEDMVVVMLSLVVLEVVKEVEIVDVVVVEIFEVVMIVVRVVVHDKVLVFVIDVVVLVVVDVVVVLVVVEVVVVLVVVDVVVVLVVVVVVVVRVVVVVVGLVVVGIPAKF